MRARQRISCLAVAACFISADVLALPVGAQVVNGTASINQAGNVLTINNSNGAIINWQQFSITAGNAVRFNQPSASSSVLNRVLASEPSVILGNLTSNGRVWLVNPAGIFVGNGVRIDTAAFVASTLDVANADFLANRMRFEANAGAGNVINRGTITTPMGGSVYLIGSNVTNEGIITTPRGETILAAGNTVELIDSASPGVKVEITGAEGNATNLGEITAEAGRIGIAGVVVRNRGRLNASSLVEEGGRIFLRASKTALVEGDGKLDATGSKGGQIDILGERVGLMDRAMLDASGATGGGKVRVGGDYQGNNPDIPNATVTYFGSQAAIKVDATKVGAGGTAIVWSDDSTRAYGRISARGGEQGGDGGFVEVSGKKVLDFRAAVDLAAPAGRGGVLLLDPQDIVLNATVQIAPTDNASPTPDVALADNPAATTTIRVADVTGFSELRLQAERDITLNSALTMAANNSVVFEAGRDIAINADLTVSGTGSISLAADKDFSGVGGATADGIGAITRSASTSVLSQATGTVTLRAGSGITATVNGTSNVLDAQTTGGSIVLDHGSGILAIDNSISLQTLTLSGGTLTGTGAITIPNGGTLNWSNATIDGTAASTLTTAAGSVVTISSSAGLGANRTWENNGATTWTTTSSSQNLTLNGTVNNNVGGVFTINMPNFAGTSIAGTGTFNNFGQLNKILNTSVSSPSFAPTFNNKATGVVNLDSGALTFNGTGSDLAGGAYNVGTGTTLQFGQSRTIASAISGAGTVAFGGNGMTYAVSGNYDISGTTQANNTCCVLTTANFTGAVTNVGSTISLGSNFNALNFTGIASGEGTAFASLTSINSSGNLSFKNGTVLSVLGSLTLGSGTTNLGDQAVTLNTVTLSGGTLTGTGAITIPNGGTLNWSNATIDGTAASTLTTAAGSVVTISSSAGLGANRTWENNGATTWTTTSSSQNLTLNGTVNNNVGGVFTINMPNFAGTSIAGTGTFNNFGQLNKILNTSVSSSTFAPTFNNKATGVVNVNSGTLALTGSLTQNGSINVAATATFQKSGGFSNSGAIEGSGTIDVGAGNTFTNNGSIRPGGPNAVGTLAVTGLLTNGAAGVIEIELLDNSTQYDKISATGNVILGGTIKANDLAGYQTVSGHTYSIITSSGGTVRARPDLT